MLGTRIVTALVLASSLLAGLFLLPPAVMQWLFAVIVGLAAWEWAGLLGMGMSSRARIGYGLLTILPCVLLLVAGLPMAWMIALWLMAVLFWLVAVPLWFRRRWPLAQHGLGWLVGWVLLIPTWAAMVVLHQCGAGWLLAAMALVWVADIAAYFAGRTWGRHKLAPTISPGKTWEGAAGAVVGVLIYAMGVVAYVYGGDWTHLEGMKIVQAVLMLLLLTAVSIIGDLFESLAKRQAGVKDSSALLPGHGGVLDRIDSLTSTLPFAALVVTLAGY